MTQEPKLKQYFVNEEKINDWLEDVDRARAFAANKAPSLAVMRLEDLQRKIRTLMKKQRGE